MGISTEDLGTPLAEFNVHWRNYWLLQALLLVLFGSGIWLLAMAHRAEGATMSGGALMLLLLQTRSMRGIDRGHHTVLYEDGVIDYHATHTTVIRWSDIAWLQSSPSRWQHPGLRIGLRNGQIHTLLTGLDPLRSAASMTTAPAPHG